MRNALAEKSLHCKLCKGSCCPQTYKSALYGGASVRKDVRILHWRGALAVSDKFQEAYTTLGEWMIDICIYRRWQQCRNPFHVVKRGLSVA
jgi:hypothetical protein